MIIGTNQHAEGTDTRSQQQSSRLWVNVLDVWPLATRISVPIEKGRQLIPGEISVSCLAPKLGTDSHLPTSK